MGKYAAGANSSSWFFLHDAGLYIMLCGAILVPYLANNNGGHVQ